MKRTIVAGMALLAISATAFLLMSGEELQSAVIPITGMHCENCADHIETELQRFDGVQAAEVNFSAAVAKIKYDAVLTTLPAIEKKIGELGYNNTNAPKDVTSSQPGNPACSPGEAETPDCCASKPQKSST